MKSKSNSSSESKLCEAHSKSLKAATQDKERAAGAHHHLAYSVSHLHQSQANICVNVRLPAVTLIKEQRLTGVD